MNNNYKKIFLTLTLALTAVAAQGASVSSKASVWYDLARNTGTPVDYNGGSISRAQATEINLDTVVFWKDNEPNDSSSEDCATQVADGTWNDLGCEQSRRVACFNGTNWTISSASVAMGADNNTAENISSAQNACPANTSFSAPVTLAQRNALSSAISAASVTNGVWINAQDMKIENVWAINKNSSAIAPFWGAGEPSGTAGDCAVIDGAGNWSASDCSASYAVACADTALSTWQVVSSSIAFTSIEKLTQACQQSFGVLYQFAAPRTSSDNTALSNALSSAGVSAAWINARDNSIEGYWMLNHGLFDWAAGEPDVNRGLCAVARQSDGRWLSADCDSRAKLLCSDGTNWIIRNADHQFSNQALDACSRPNSATGTNTFANYRLKTPVTEPERMRVYQLIRAQSNDTKVWLNLKRVQDTGLWLWNQGYEQPDVGGSNLAGGVWYDTLNNDNEDLSGPWKRYSDGVNLNIAQARAANKLIYSNFDWKEPNDTGGCVQMYTSGGNAGLWDDYSCSQSQKVACFDGYDWAISSAAVGIGADSETNENLSNAQNACAAISKQGVSGNFRFAAPITFRQSMNLLSVAQNSGVTGDVWININDKRYNRTFVYNLGADVIAPFWNAGEPNDAGGNEDCAVQQRTTGLWNDLPCASSVPLACYNPYAGANGTWSVTATSHSFTTPTALSLVCEQSFGGQFKFYAPVTLSQRNDLVAVMAAAAVDNVYINVSDQESEGTWLLNVDINNWAEGQPSVSSNERCVAADVTDSQWRTRNCADALPVACTTGGRWYFTENAINLTDFSAGQQACNTLGSGYLFNAPRTLDDAQQMQYFALLAGVGGNFWINGNRLEDIAVWEWNQRSLKTPLWSSVEPNGGTRENCALLNNDAEASWADERCDSGIDRAYLCRNGSSWQISVLQGALEDFSQAVTACAALGSGWVFAAPATYNENLAAKNAMGAVAQVWVNATDAMKEGVWTLNAASISQYPNWALGQPDNGGLAAADETALLYGEDCVYQDDSGRWSDTACTSAAEYSWACNDGYVWKVTRSQGTAANPADGHKACFTEYGSTFVFAAPLNKNDSIQIDFARLLASDERGSNIARVWLNMNDGGYEDNRSGAADGRHFRKNQPFTNWISAYPGQEPLSSCAYKSTTAAGQNNPWRTASCTSFAAHYACTDGAAWNVATSKGALVNGSLQVVPQVGEDYWSYDLGNSRCKEQFGEQYYFSAPVTAAEEFALDAAIRNTNAQVKNTWINYYYVNAITSANNRWFADRLKLGIWQKPVFRNLNNADCSVLHPDGSWTDVSCNASYAYACFDGSWSITGLSGRWDEGFAACDNQSASLFAVPRSPDEMAELLGQMSGQPVWINLTDTALESQWIANRLRFSWWRTGEPSNSGNRDCGRIAESGEWYAGKCSVEQASFACRTVTGSAISWNITTGVGIWSEGFSACAREYPGSEFFVPQGYGTHSASMDQNTLAAIIAAAGRDAWINLSDQDVEGHWRAYQAYSDWGVASLLDQNNDCAYLDRVVAGSGTWYTDSCKYTSGTPVSRGYACTNGYEWRLVNTTADTSVRWSEGFTACQTLGSDWRYAAPTDAVQNAKLRLAMELSGISQIWINAQDRTDEGNWQINGPETNFAPVADTSLTALVVAENTSNVQLHALLEDDEEVGIASASWSLVSDSRFSNVADSDVVVSSGSLVAGAAGSAILTASYSSPLLLNQDAVLVFKVTATDIPPGTALAATSETFITVRVKSPLLAAWDFNDSASPQRDVTGNGHNALNDGANPLPPVVGGALALSAADVMIVPGLAAQPDGGLDVPASEYTVAFRISIEEAASGTWRGILQKGDGGMERQPGIFLYPDAESLHATNSTNQSDNRSVDIADIPLRQWLNVVYSKRADGLDIYLDDELVGSYPFAGGEQSLINTGNLYVGNIPGAAESFTGLIDDVQVYNRVLNAAERLQILPAPPLGEVQFVQVGSLQDEDAGSVTLLLERSRGSKAPLTVYVDINAAASTATLGNQTDMTDPLHPADLAFGAAYVSGTGVPVTWPADTRGQQSLTITLDSADDNLREGTEIARLQLADIGGAATGLNSTFTLRLNDVTPNPFGNFSVTGPDPMVVLENNPATQSICIVRESGAQGEVTVNYSINGTAVAGTDFNYLPSGIEPVAASGSVTFADGDSVDKCFDIAVVNNPAIGTPDINLQVTITGLNHDAGLDPLLTAQNQAQLVIRDYAPGEFGFVSSTLTCKEPNTATAVPDELKPTAAELICEVSVVRTNTGLYAPAAQLNVVQIAHTPDDAPQNDLSFTPVLNWEAKASGSAAEDVQTVVFTLQNDGEQESDEVVAVQLQATNGDGHNEVINQADLQLTMVDVTEPALVTASVAGAPAGNILDVDEGTAVTINLARTLNENTEFTTAYALSATSLGSQNLTDILSLQVDGASTPVSGALAFTRNTGSSRAFTINTIDTVEPGDNRVVKVRLDQVNPDRIAGLGDRANANKDTQNFTEVAFRIKNTRDYLDNIFLSASATKFDSVGSAALNSSAFTNVEHITRDIQPVHGYINLNAAFNGFDGIYDIQDTALLYSVTFYQNGTVNSVINGQNMASLLRKSSDPEQAFNATGSIPLDKDTGAVFNPRLLIPYVTDGNSADVEMKVRFVGNVTGDVKEQTYRFRPQVVWRRMEYDDNNECLYYESDGRVRWQFAGYDGGNCKAVGINNQTFTYNAFTEQIESRGRPGQCLEAESSNEWAQLWVRSCDAVGSVRNTQRFYMESGFRVINRANTEELLCGETGFANNPDVVLRRPCSYGNWEWWSN
ncbi:MAG: hypothetical protein COB09_00095 [Thalassobium sp.]|nr:MAG: hypothetical protein COB09_00095 [Thalassobium sp.]